MEPPESAQRRASSASAAVTRRGVGCVAGLFRLLSPYHRHRKRLIAKNFQTPQSPPPSEKLDATPSSIMKASPQPSAAVRRRRSCEAPRSPTITPEFRRASCDSPRPPPPAIVARLMGLEESAPPSPAVTPRPRPLPTRPPPPPPPEMAAEKRRKLLGALEKCDEDLKTLRRIIAAVRAAEMRAAAASDVSATDGEGKGSKWMVNGRDEPSPTLVPAPPHQKPRPEQYPSPDSVLDAITSPRFPCRKRQSPCTNAHEDSNPGCCNALAGSKMVKPSRTRTLVFSGDYYKIRQYCNELHAVAMHHPHPAAAEGIAPVAVEAEGCRRRGRWSAAGRRRAMGESVEEVWGQGPGEERWEAGLVGAALERAILQDLVREIVAELLAQAQPGRAVQPPVLFGQCGGSMCRKRLCF